MNDEPILLLTVITRCPKLTLLRLECTAKCFGEFLIAVWSLLERRVGIAETIAACATLLATKLVDCGMDASFVKIIQNETLYEFLSCFSQLLGSRHQPGQPVWVLAHPNSLE